MRNVASPLDGFRSPFGVRDVASQSNLPISARFWRVYISEVDGGGYSEAKEVRFLRSVGDPAPLSGSAIASSSFGGSTADKAFDNNTGTFWTSGDGTSPQWIGYDFGSGNAEAITALTYNQDSGRAPKTFKVQYSDDGSVWNDCGWDVELQTVWIGARTFVKPTGPSNAKRRWRLLVTAPVNTGDYVNIEELTFKTTGDVAIPYTGFFYGSGYYGTAFVERAFDGNSSTNWLSPNNTMPHWLVFDFGGETNVTGVTITATDGGRRPKDFALQYSNDGTSWTTDWSVAGATWSSSTQTFTKP